MCALKQMLPWHLGSRTFEWGQRTYVMGILNVTPDSFSDGGQFHSLETALKQAQALIAADVDILDIGGQSTRPHAEDLSLQVELERVVPVIKAIRQVSNIPISIDTTKAKVAEAAVIAGADAINDISGAVYDPEMLPTAARLGVPIVLMHLRGNPQTMQQLTTYENLIDEVMVFLRTRVEAAVAAGVARHHIAVDPGIGFAKTGPQSIELLRNLSAFQGLGCPILVGPSRKSFIGHILHQPDPTRRVWGTAAACCGAIAGGADMVRVHDAEIVEVCRVADAVWRTCQISSEGE